MFTRKNEKKRNEEGNKGNRKVFMLLCEYLNLLRTGVTNNINDGTAKWHWVLIN